MGNTWLAYTYCMQLGRARSDNQQGQKAGTIRVPTDSARLPGACCTAYAAQQQQQLLQHLLVEADHLSPLALPQRHAQLCSGCEP